jgi:triosephosphate isomerase (TIM)
MAKKLLIAGNWKMNLTPHQASLLIHRLDQKIKVSSDVRVVLCPPFTDLYSVSRDIDSKKFKLGSQTLSHLDDGPHTGEISAAMLHGLVDYAIVGHSERRREMGERDQLIAKKLAAALRHGITPILCVGDQLADRQQGHSRRVVNDQLTVNLSMITAVELGQIVIAYEPVWAISSGDGHGTFAKPYEVAPMIQSIRETIEDLYGEGYGTNALILYGGSVNPDNTRAYVELPGVDGLLVGGASLNYEEFAKIVEIAQAVSKDE